MASCLVTERVAGPCARCGEFQAKKVHLVDSEIILCVKCCPWCGRQPTMDWSTEAPVTTSGVQEGLFG